MVSFFNKIRSQSLKPNDLLNAVYSRNIKKVDEILTLRPDLVNTIVYNDPIFFATCEYDKMEMCRLFISKGANVKDGALLHACSLGSLEIIQLLLDAGANVSVRDARGRTVLHFVSGNMNFSKVFPLLLALGADINSKDGNGTSPLHFSVNSLGGPIKEFIDAGADVNALDNNGKTPLHYAVEGTRGSGVTEALLQGKADPNLTDSAGMTPFDYALLQGHYGRSHVAILQKYGGKPRSVSTGRQLSKEITVQLPERTREGNRVYSANISSYYDVIGAVHAWYDNDCRSSFGVDKATMYIRSIGEELNRQGGFNLMSEIANAIDREYPGLGSRLNQDWDRIGSWRG